MMKPLMILGLTACLAACSGATTRLDMSPVESKLNLRANIDTAMVRTVSLPSYAAAEELSISATSFDVKAPVTAPTPAGIADAQARAILMLSEQIARKIAR